MRMKKRVHRVGASAIFMILLAGCLGFWAHAASSGHHGLDVHHHVPPLPPAMSPAEVRSLYMAIASVPSSPIAFVNAYMRALSSGSGLYARAYLSSSLWRTLPASVGYQPEESVWHPWITAWKITSNESKMLTTKIVSRGSVYKYPDAVNYLTVMAYGSLNPPSDTEDAVALFRDRLTVTSEDVANLNGSPPYYISAQSISWLHPRSMRHF